MKKHPDMKNSYPKDGENQVDFGSTPFREGQEKKKGSQ